METSTHTNEQPAIGVSSTKNNVTNSQTASDYINEQLALEADAKEILPFKFDKCTYSLGPLRQSVFACLTCNPPPASAAQVYIPAGVCYACSISCHGEHNLVELFSRRNFTCDCGTTRIPSSSPCMLRLDTTTNRKGVSLEEASKTNTYNQNFQNRFCGCKVEYDAETEKGTMYQCLGLGTVETGGCGEDWWHPHCLMGKPSDWLEKARTNGEVKTIEGTDNIEEDHPAPEGFPEDSEFSSIICYKCVKSNPWMKPYVGTEEFLPPIHREPESEATTLPVASVTPVTEQTGSKRKASDDGIDGRSASPVKRLKEENDESNGDQYPSDMPVASHKHDRLKSAPQGIFSIAAKKNFREQLCHCPKCYPNLIPHPQLLDEEDEYEPSLSDSEESLIGDGTGPRSHGTASLLDRGEAALNTMDRVKAIEGVMVYNHLKDKVKEFLKPYAETGKAVGAEDIKAYFEKLRGDEAAIKEASTRPTVGDDDDTDDKRHEQSGY